MTYTLYQGDCLEVMPTLEANSVDTVITDPPWMDYQTGWYDASEWHQPIVAVEPQYYMPEFYRVMKNDTAMLVWCRWDSFELHAQAARDAGFVVRNCVVWAKPNHTAGDLDGNLGNKHEMAVFAVKGNWKRHDKREVNLWDEEHLFTRAYRDHPTQKPVHLMRRSVVTTTMQGATILDPFMGSGTTGVACRMEGRNFIGIELDAHYYRIAERRIANAQPPLFVADAPTGSEPEQAAMFAEVPA